MLPYHDQPMTGLSGKRIVVTGAASGIGAATCTLLAASGCQVAGIDRQAEALAHVMRDLGQAGHVTVQAIADVSDVASVELAIAAAAGELGGLDAAVNVAGIGSFSGDIVATSVEDWRAVIDVDLSGVFYVSRAAIPFLRKAGGGVIVNISSQYGLVGCADSPAYCAAKAGVIGLTRAMAIDHAGEGIRVNCVCPGPISTPMLAANERRAQAAKRERERSRGRVLLGRPGRPEDVAGLIAFLLSAEASNMTGSIVTTDGGWTAA
jgi:meso-butanediol dehydrogenase / (S,S)-butanediol dehydrogenase / diacetyl reductase